MSEDHKDAKCKSGTVGTCSLTNCPPSAPRLLGAENDVNLHHLKLPKIILLVGQNAHSTYIESNTDLRLYSSHIHREEESAAKTHVVVN